MEEQSGIQDIARAPQCKVCRGARSLKRCAKCRIVFYCSEKHQRKDWNRHRINCQKTYQIGTLTNELGMQPVILPVSTGRIETLRRDAFAKLLKTFPEDVQFGPGPFQQEEGMVYAQSAAMLKEKCLDFLGIFFYLSPRKDFRPSHALTHASLSASLDANARRLVFGEALQIFINKERLKCHPWTVQAVWLPMNGTRPIVVKMRIQKSDDTPMFDDYMGYPVRDGACNVLTIAVTDVHDHPDEELQIYYFPKVESGITVRQYANHILVKKGVSWAACPAGSAVVMKRSNKKYVDTHLSDMAWVYDYYRQQS